MSVEITKADLRDLGQEISRAVDKKIDTVNQTTDKKIDDVFDVLQTFIKQVDKRFDQVDKRFDRVDGDMADMRGAIAELSAQVRDYHNEMVFMNHHIDKLTEAIKQIAAETGVKLKVEI